MSDLRSRAVVLGVTSGAAVLLAVPVVASGQVPGVDQVVGGVNHAAQRVVQAAPAPPVRLPAAPTAPAPRPAPAAQAPAPAAPAPAPAPSAPATTTRSATATASQGSGGSVGSAGGHSANRKQANGGSSAGSVSAHAAADRKARAADDAAAGTDTQIADDPASAPRDASPATLPFTGLQLALMVMLGMAALAAGAALRRGVRTRRA